MRRYFILCALFVGLPLGWADEWETLFDGETLAGWHNPYEWGEAGVENGEIHLIANRKFFLATEREFSDFILEVEFKMPEGISNSGIQFRSDVGENRVRGYQAEIDPSPRAWTGGIYGEQWGAWRFQPRSPANSPSGQAFRTATEDAYKAGQWNSMRIECLGSRMRVFVNGILCSDYFDDGRAKGIIALQHHGERGQTYRFRNIRIKEVENPSIFGASARLFLDEDFSSADVSQWKMTDSSAWKISEVDGAKVLHLHSQSDYTPPVRSPRNILWLLDDGPDSFVMDVIVKSTGRPIPHRDLCFFFGKQDDTHFYYAHLAPGADNVSHMIHAVDGAPRTAITANRNDGIDWGDDWHRIRIERDATSGAIRVYFNDLENPVMEANDSRFIGGGIGIGSFDQSGYFDQVRIVEVK